MKIVKSVSLGFMFCLAQSIGESVLAYWFIKLKGTSDINFEGMMLYAFIRIILTALPYMLLYTVSFRIMKKFMMPALIALCINVFVLISFYLFGFYQKEPVIIMFSSILLSSIFLIANKRIERQINIAIS